MEPDPGHDRRERISTILLFLALGAAFLAVGLAFTSTRVFVEEADLFDADARRVVHDLARRYGPHDRTRVHPLFVLLLNPAGALLKELIGRPRPAAVLLNAAAAALGVVLFRELLVRLGVGRRRSILWSLAFALSASQVFFGVVPETYSFSATSLLLLFVVFAAPRPHGAACLAAALVSFGVTTTNLVAGVLLAFLRPPRTSSRGRALARAVAFGCVVVAAAAVASLVQKGIYAGSAVFFLPSSYTGETEYVARGRDAASLLRRGGDLATNLLFSNLAAPQLRVELPAGVPPVTRFGRWRPANWMHAAVWGPLLLAAFRAGRPREPSSRRVVEALLLWIAFNVGLHSLYGETFFLYSCHWTFAVLAVVATAVEVGGSARALRAVTALLTAMVGLQAWANGSFLTELYRVYR